MGYTGTCVTSLNSMIKIDLMEKMKSEQTLEKGKEVNHKLFRGRMFWTVKQVQSP